jgi:TolB-like protein/tetratricopeptide (TPR) repeat protein
MTTPPIGPDRLVGHKLDHYHVSAKIGAGGMGVVYRAHDEHLDREVAIKVLPPGALTDKGARKRFRKEALALSKLNHPNVATIHDFDCTGDTDYLVMEYVPGKTLRDRISEGALSEAEITGWASQLAEGLIAAHKLGIVHCDLKPENVRLTTDGRVKILDFGLARLIRASSEIGNTTESYFSVTGGTFPYMSPEQVLGGVVDERSDLFSLGVVLYEMATGKLPFQGDTPGAISEAILHRTPVPPSRINPGTSAGLETIVTKALEKDRQLRYQSASEVRTDLERLESGGVGASGTTHSSRQLARHGALPRWAAIASVALLLTATAAGVYFWKYGRLPTAASPPPSIAVLPFVNMSGDAGQEYFSDGLSEELLNDLAHVPGLRVAGRTSSFHFKGKNEDLRKIGQSLNVGTVLEGSVRKEGNRVRITAQLVSVKDGYHLWSETYDREMSSIFSVQSEIAGSVTSALQLKLLGTAANRHASGTNNVEAYNAYLQGQQALYSGVNADSLNAAEGYLERAIQFDPNYAKAWALLSVAHLNRGFNLSSPDQQALAKGRAEAEKALSLDANSADAYRVVGWIKRMDWDWEGWRVAVERASVLSPSDPRALYALSLYYEAMGRRIEAITALKQAVSLDPLNGVFSGTLASMYFDAGSHQEAMAQARATLAMYPQNASALLIVVAVLLAQGQPQQALEQASLIQEPELHAYALAQVYHDLKRPKEADAALQELIKKYSANWAFMIAGVYAYRADADQAFEWLERAYRQREAGCSTIKANADFVRVRSDPRYAAFLRKMNLPLE